MVVKAATKKRLMDNGVPESVAHLLADDRTIEEVKDLGIHHIAEKIYGLHFRTSADFEEMFYAKRQGAKLQKARIIYYLIDLDNRELPQNNSPKSASFGIFNWWWGEVGNNEQPPNFLQRFLDLHELSKVELRMKVAPKIRISGHKSALVAMVLKEELE